MAASFTSPCLLAAKPKGKPSERDTDYGGRAARLAKGPKKPEKDTDYGS